MLGMSIYFCFINTHEPLFYLYFNASLPIMNVTLTPSPFPPVLRFFFLLYTVQHIKFSFVRKIVIFSFAYHNSVSRIFFLSPSLVSSSCCAIFLLRWFCQKKRRISHKFIHTHRHSHTFMAITKNIISMCRSIIKHFNKKRHDTIDIADTMHIFDICILYT